MEKKQMKTLTFPLLYTLDLNEKLYHENLYYELTLNNNLEVI